MRLSDEVFLETLRKSVAANVDPLVWESLEKKVDEVGIRGLTGSGRALVEGLVRKHGSHNQKVHSPNKGGGGSTSGGDAAEGAKGGGGSAGAPMSSTQRTAAAKDLVSSGDATKTQVVSASMKDVSMKSSSGLPEGSKGTLLATGVDMGGGRKGSLVGFSKPVKQKTSDGDEVEDTIHMVYDSDHS